MKFKVGDIIKVVEGPHPVGEVWKIRRVDRDRDFGVIYYLNNSKDSDSCYPFYNNYNIKHHRVNYTKLAEKMYPKGHKDGDFWVLG